LRLLGAVELRHAGGTELVAVIRQPKRLALLAFLALRPGSRWVRRDELLATFWPDLDTEHARASLRRALYFLRQELGEGIVAGRGSEELGVSPGALWCDVTEFQEAIAAREWERALALYRGDLLQGIFIAGADRRTDGWNANGAPAYRRGEAAGVLARAAGGWEAVEWSGGPLALSPCEDASVQRLMQQLANLGDRAGALRVIKNSRGD
jgi:serine/threonine-protein kinase